MVNSMGRVESGAVLTRAADIATGSIGEMAMTDKIRMIALIKAFAIIPVGLKQ
ncbi:hypothetical protein [Brenneria tiliae]|uniref:hypothetical protein n=1 Tax=Brenneria tiliae TaxID=2914984 RepID=UPI0020149274|nr:hypothetical protein [Brenneria tiliae]MCL2898236.1 hypothetical protein [Brenneria tiliae]MCL2902586.1 hypothetical protein [Brenneria tiliae]